MQFLDLIVIFFLILGFIWGFGKGIIYMFFSLLGIVCGVLLGIKIPPLFFDIFKIKPLFLYNAISFILIFSICYIIIINIGNYISELLENLDIGWLDAFLGGITGLLQIAIIIGIGLSLLEKYNILYILPDFEKSTIPLFLKKLSGELLKYFSLIKN